MNVPDLISSALFQEDSDGNPAIYNLLEYGFRGNNTKDNSSALTDLLVRIGSSDATILSPAGAYMFKSNVTIPSNITIIMLKGSIWKPTTGVTLTINAKIIADPYQIFGDSGTIAGAFDKGFVYPEWWGAKADWDGTTGFDNISAITKAINYLVTRGGGDILLQPAAYRVTSTVNCYTAAGAYLGIRINGRGMHQTRIVLDANNIPILKIGGYGNEVNRLQLAYKLKQSSSNTSAVGIYPMRLYQSDFFGVSIDGAYAGMMLGSASPEFSTNFMFSCTYQSMEITRFSGYGIHYNPYFAGNTGSTYKNIYFNNQDPRGNSTVLTAKTAFFLKFASESTLEQINVEWGNLESAFRFESCNNLSVESTHVEGVTFIDGPENSRYRGVYENINSNIVFHANSCQNIRLNTTDVALFYSEGTAKWDINGFEEWSTVLNGNNLKRFYAPSAGDNMKIYYKNMKTLYATTDVLMSEGILRDADAGNAIKKSAAPTSGTWTQNQIVWNNAPSAGGTMGWVCTTSGTITSAWQPSLGYLINDLVQPTVDNGHVYKNTNSGVSGAVEPTWPTTAGATVTDSVPFGGTAWQATHSYANGNTCIPTTPNGFYYAAQGAGTSGSTEPIWPTTAGATIVDGTITWIGYPIAIWQEVGGHFTFKAFGTISA